MRQPLIGAMVNVTSVSGWVAFSLPYAYATSKLALEAVSEILAHEVRRIAIRVGIIELGVIGTAIFTKPRRESDRNSPYVDLIRPDRRIVVKRLMKGYDAPDRTP